MTTTNNTSPPLRWAITGGKMDYDYFEYMLQNEMERIESLENAIEADSAPVEQQVEREIDWENIPWENF